MIDYKKTAINVLGLILICATVLGAIFLGVYFWPFLVAIIFAVILERSINYIVKKTKAPRKAVATVLVILVYVIIAVVAYLVISSLIREAISLSTKLPSVYEDLKTNYTGMYKDLSKMISDLPETVSNSIYKTGLELLDNITKIAGNILKGVIDFVLALPDIMIYVVVTFLATLFLVTDRRTISRYAEELWPNKTYRKISNVMMGCFKTLGKYLKSQCILICITFIELFISFIILKQPYPLTLAVVVAIVDALPILGTGTVLIPWAIYAAITGDIGLGIGLMVAYIIITIVRQLIEPKIVSDNLGIHPFVTLIAMYVGFKIFGLFGLIIGPVVMVIYKNVFSIMFETGYLKKIFVYKKEKDIKPDIKWIWFIKLPKVWLRLLVIFII